MTAYTGLVDDASIKREKFDAACDCGRSVSRTIGEWQREPTSVCPECGATIKVDTGDLDKSERAVDRGLADINRQMRKIGS